MRKRKRLIWPWMLGLGVLVIIMLPFLVGAGNVLIDRWRDSREVTVTMEVTGTAPTGRVEIDRGDKSDPETIDDVTFPWRTTFTVKGTDKFVSVTGRPDSVLKRLSCSIVANGQLIAEDQYEGPVARCSGNANGDSSQLETTTSTPSPPPAGPPPQSDVWAGLTLPRGSLSQDNSTNPSREDWELPMPFADTVTYLREKLPVDSNYDGRPFCGEINESELVLWSWGTQANDVYVVSVHPDITSTGTDVAISRQPYAQDCSP